MVLECLGHVGSTYSYSVGSVVGMGESLVFVCGGTRPRYKASHKLIQRNIYPSDGFPTAEKPCKYYDLRRMRPGQGAGR